MRTTTTKPTGKRGRPAAQGVMPKPHAVYPTTAEKALLQQYASHTRRTLGAAILYLALSNPEFQSTTKLLEGGQA